MKALAMALAALALFAGISTAEAAPKTVYTVTMTGVTWNGCKKHVREAFTKLEGVTNIVIAAGDTAETQKVTFDSTTDKHTKEDLVKSIGKEADKYVVKEVKKAAAKSGAANAPPGN